MDLKNNMTLGRVGHVLIIRIRPLIFARGPQILIRATQNVKICSITFKLDWPQAKLMMR